MNDPFVVAVAIVVFCVVVCTIAGIVLAGHMWPFVTSREVEIDVVPDLSDLDMFDRRIDDQYHRIRIERLHADIADCLKHGQYDHAHMLNNEVTELIEILAKL